MGVPAQTNLRTVTVQEKTTLRRLVKATNERVDTVRRAQALLAVESGQSLGQAARTAGFRSGEAVSQLIERFNERGMQALFIAAGRGRKATYGSEAQTRILQELQREPDREEDTTGNWSLKTLEKSLRTQDLPAIGATTIGRVLHEAGYSVQQSRTWCPTGSAQRKRKAGVVTVRDPQTEEKKG
jgi:transposase